MQNGRIYRKGSAWILSYAVKAQEPDGKITWARRSKRLAPYGDDTRATDRQRVKVSPHCPHSVSETTLLCPIYPIFPS